MGDEIFLLVAPGITTSFIEINGRITSIIHLCGCNLSCNWCHNFSLRPEFGRCREMTPSEIARDIIIDPTCECVSVSGGEPTVNPSFVADFLHILRRYRPDLYLSMDTNATRPNALKYIISKGLLDRIAIDLKGNENVYRNMCGYYRDGSIETFLECIRIVLGNNLDIIVRTVVSPSIIEADSMSHIYQKLSSILRNTCTDKERFEYRVNSLKPSLCPPGYRDMELPSPEFINSFVKTARKYGIPSAETP